MEKRKSTHLLTIAIVIMAVLACMVTLTACKNDGLPTPQVEIGDVWDGTVSEVSSEVDGIILIETAEELAGLAQAVNNGNSYKGKTVKLTENLDLKNINWEPIGKESYTFQGVFDGDGKTICNLKIEKQDQSNVGLFGFTTNGEIKNLKIFNANVKGRLNVGVVAGTPYTSKYTDITVEGKVVVDGMAYVGGVLGKNVYANLTNITVNATENSYVKAHSIENDTAYRTYVGGVVGFIGEGSHEIKNVHSNIDVLGSTVDVGGIAGIAHYQNVFTNCSSTGDVTIYNGDKEDGLEIGGIAGVWHNQNDKSVTLTGCVYTGKLTIKYADGSTYDGEFTYGNLVGVPYSKTGTGTLIIDGQEYTAQD